MDILEAVDNSYPSKRGTFGGWATKLLLCFDDPTLNILVFTPCSIGRSSSESTHTPNCLVFAFLP